MPKPVGKLTFKQARFIDEYLVDLNATQAAIRAGYSKKTAYRMGYENLKKPQVAEVIQKRRDELKESLEIDQEWLLRRYIKLSDYKITDFFDDNGNMKSLSDIPESSLYAIQGYEVSKNIKDKETYIHKFKTSDKKAALDSIAKLLGLEAPSKLVFPDKDGIPQDLSSLSPLEMATRVLGLINEAKRLKKESKNE